MVYLAWRLMGVDLKWRHLAFGLLMGIFAWVADKLWEMFRSSILFIQLVRWVKRHKMLSWAVFIVGGAALGVATRAALGWVREGDLPALVVRPIGEMDDYYLDVRNLGAKGTFDADITILERPSRMLPGIERNDLPAYWERSKRSDTEIKSGSRDRIVVGRSGGGRYLDLYFYDLNQGARGTIRDGNPGPGPIPEGRGFVFTLTITSEPPMSHGPLVDTYSLTPHGLKKVRER